MKTETATKRITALAFEILEQSPDGIRWSQLNSRIQEADETLHPKTINGLVWKLAEKYPDLVYKPSKGVFRLVKFK